MIVSFKDCRITRISVEYNSSLHKTKNVLQKKWCTFIIKKWFSFSVCYFLQSSTYSSDCIVTILRSSTPLFLTSTPAWKMLKELTNQKPRKCSPVCIIGMMPCFLRHAYICLWKPLWKLQNLWIIYPSHHFLPSHCILLPQLVIEWTFLSPSPLWMIIFLKNQTTVNNLICPPLLASSRYTTWVVLPQGLHKKDC